MFFSVRIIPPESAKLLLINPKGIETPSNKRVLKTLPSNQACARKFLKLTQVITVFQREFSLRNMEYLVAVALKGGQHKPVIITSRLNPEEQYVFYPACDIHYTSQIEKALKNRAHFSKDA